MDSDASNLMGNSTSSGDGAAQSSSTDSDTNPSTSSTSETNSSTTASTSDTNNQEGSSTAETATAPSSDDEEANASKKARTDGTFEDADVVMDEAADQDKQEDLNNPFFLLSPKSLYLCVNS